MARKEIEFYEHQFQSQCWAWILMIAINAIFIVGFVWQVLLGNTFGNNPMSDAGLIITTALIFAFSAFLLSSNLNTYINNDGVYVRYFPFHRKSKFWSWNDVQAASIINYRPITQFGGWGIRTNFKTKAYTVSGTCGLLLILKDGRKILIGTKQPDEIETIIKKRLQ